MANTHGYVIVGDGHTRGNKNGPPTLLDPKRGLLLTTLGETQPAVLNTIVRSPAGPGGLLTAMARVTRIVAAGVYHVEILLRLPTDVPWAFVAGAAVTYDSGGTAAVGSIVSATSHQGQFGAADENAITGRRDALFNSFLPDDGSDDTVFWDRFAKRARRVRIASGWTGTWLPGDRITTSGGGAFTVLSFSDPGGGAADLWVVRTSGSIAVAQTLTNTTVPGGTATISQVDAATTAGEWKRLAFLPNDNGWGAAASGSVDPLDRYEQIPFGDGSNGSPGYGPMHTLLRKAYDFWKADATPANRGVRGFLMDAQDYSPPSMLFGGVTVQCIEVSGGSGTFQVGELVSSGTWSATVHNKTASRLFVHTPNGQVLVALTTLTGATSGATCTATSTCIGWQPGSAHWQNLVAEKAAAEAAPGSLFGSSPLKYEGVLLMIWESEMGSFVTGNATPATEALMVQQWTLFITALRALYGDPALPITLWQMDARSHPEISLFGYAWANITRSLFSILSRTITGIALTSTSGMEGASYSALPYPSSVLWLRPDDYLEIGTRAWRSLQFAATPIPPGRWQPMLLVLDGGQSNMTGSMSSSIMSIDRDPALWKSASFPGVSSIDPDVWQWNSDPNVQAWEAYDIALNGNPFWGQFGFSPVQAALAQRLRRRFAQDGVYVDIGFIHVPVNGSTANAATPNAWTWDPDAPPRAVITASQTVTVFGVTGSTLNPKRGRFTAASNLYSSFAVGATVQVSGSALGFVGSGGNNHSTYGVGAVHAIAGDGTWIEINGEHVAETATFTLQIGTIAIMPVVKDQIRAAIGACATQLQRIAQPIAIAWDQGESDIFNPDNYQQALQRVLEELIEEFGLQRRGSTPLGVVIVRQTSQTPWGTDQQVAAIQTAQANVAAALPNAAIIATDDPIKFPMEGAGIYPKTVRQHNNVHRALRALIEEGYQIDRALGTLQGFPAHPDGELAAVDDIGAVDGGGTDAGAGPVEGVVDGVGTDAPATEVAASTLRDAMNLQPDVAGWSITRDGKSVQRRSLREMIEYENHLESRSAREQGLDTTIVDLT